MKKYINKKTLFIFLILVILATLLSAYLNSIGYKGFLYFQTVYTNNGHRSYGNFSPRTGGFLITGVTISYLAFTWKKMNNTNLPIANYVIGTLFIIGIAILIIGGTDLVNAILFILNR